MAIIHLKKPIKRSVKISGYGTAREKCQFDKEMEKFQESCLKELLLLYMNPYLKYFFSIFFVYTLFNGIVSEVGCDSSELQIALNGNSIIENTGLTSISVSNTGPTTTTLHRERSTRAFYTRMPSVGKSADVRIGKTVSESKINALFDIYKEPGEDNILAEGIERLCADLGLSPDEFKVLLLAWKLDAGQMCKFTRDEFVNGCRSMCVDTIHGIKNKLPEIATQVASSPDVFKDLYRFTFRFGLDSSIGQRILPADMAILLWKLVFSVREPPILDRWLNFLETHEHIRGIPRDTWNMFLNFSEAVGDDLSMYDDTEAWPSIFDDFVEFENDQANQNITSKDKDEVIH